MTAIKPIENRHVHSVASERYPLNKKCSHPECNEPAVDPHHAFPRSLIKGDSWFVQIDLIDTGAASELTTEGRTVKWIIIPHVTGACRAHHDDYEARKLWLRWNVEDDGLWTVWEAGDGKDGVSDKTWAEIGPLNPQPGSVEGKPKRARLKGEQRRKRKTISIRVPDDTENGADLWDELVEYCKTELVKEGLYEEGALIPNYEALYACLTDWRNSR